MTVGYHLPQPRIFPLRRIYHQNRQVHEINSKFQTKNL